MAAEETLGDTFRKGLRESQTRETCERRGGRRGGERQCTSAAARTKATECEKTMKSSTVGSGGVVAESIDAAGAGSVKRGTQGMEVGEVQRGEVQQLMTSEREGKTKIKNFANTA